MAPRVTFEGLLRDTTIVSSGSSSTSSFTVTEMVFAVSPGAKVRVPPARV